MENIDGSGGLSASVIDVARVLAALSQRSGQPILDESTRYMMFNNADTNGYHGFDWLQAINVPEDIYRSQGGLLPTSANAIYFTTGGGFSYVLCWNGLSPEGEKWYPVFKAILAAAINYQWDEIDLFPEYGMSSLPTLEPTTERWPDIHRHPISYVYTDPFTSPLQRPRNIK